ncbi:F-box/LRR-repeat protein At3g58900-like [Silene latifolia]|uniref:F-box/LRR-repeat protein At3g58900-like n=1 Tax=Silene latifolia TaxID=37657 RepID=UPI003D789E4D
MDFGERKRSVCPESQETEKTDRISNLPDEILGHILSFVPTKYAVAASILSSRWKDLYKLTTNLDFDDSLSIHPQFRLGTPDRSSCFRKFVDRVLDQCKKSQITRFRLKCAKHVKKDLVTDWINVALSSYKVPELELSVKLGVPFALQLPAVARRNLKVLKLDCNFILRVPKLVTFPCLKILFFKQIEFPGDSLNGILSGCPLLEELVIIGCDWNGSDLFFSNPLLKKLTLDVGIGGVLDQVSGSSIHFNLPSLVYLKYIESLPEQYFITNLDSVVDAHFEVAFNDEEFEDQQELCDIMVDVIFGISNCEILYLSRQCLEALASGDFALPAFQNLTQLKLGQGCNVSWNHVLLRFLNKSPCLESLTLVQVNTNDELDDDCLFGDHPVPSCVSSCLKVINLKNFAGLKEEMGMVEYFLEKANDLEQMVIHWRKRNGASEKEIEIEIEKLPRASKTSSISFK